MIAVAENRPEQVETRVPEVQRERRSIVVAGVDPRLPTMSAWVARQSAHAFPLGARALVSALDEARRKAEAPGGSGAVAVVLPSARPDLIVLAGRVGATRVLMFHSGGALGPVREVATRAALSLVDLTIVPDALSERAAVRLGADPNRIAHASEPAVERALAEPRRRHLVAGALEAAISLALDAAEVTGLVDLTERVALRHGVNVINYHRVLPLDELRAYSRPQMAIASPLFEAQLEVIASRRGFVPVEEVHEQHAAGKVAVTFDDGYEDNYRVAFPILQRFSVPACVFIVTSLIGRPEAPWWDRIGFMLYAFWRAGSKAQIPWALPARAHDLRGATSVEQVRRIISDVVSVLNSAPDAERRAAIDAAEALMCSLPNAGEAPRRMMLSWEEIAEMRRLGIRFGSHTRNHACLDLLAAHAAREELLGGQADLEQRLAPRPGEPRLVALPRGKLGALNEEDLRALGFDAVMTTEAGTNHDDDPSLLVLRRDGRYLTLRGRHHPAKLRLELTGLLDPFRPGKEGYS